MVRGQVARLRLRCLHRLDRNGTEVSVSKLLVANRGEIAVRAFRAATELDIETVAVYTYEDQRSLHRQKADESYQIGEVGHPLRAYLDPELIVRTAVEAGADAIYPGYGFMSESPDLAEACERAGLVFVGPSSSVLTLAGNKMRARQSAADAGLPVLDQSGAIESVAALKAAAADLGFPLFVKAASGGGGRGLRLVSEPARLVEAYGSAVREAESAFGDPTVFLERAVTDPRHIEVQVLGDAVGAVVHLFERDCSIQRRHQKVIEIAPAPGLDPEIRDAMCADAVAYARALDYENAGTVEFLLDPGGHYVFIEMNPRIQVEHTVTEETTDVDLVQSQLRIAGGETLADLGLIQDRITQRGTALQCRVTTEDPANDFRPDSGRIVAYRTPGGAGIRLDGGVGYLGADISPYFDSLLVKLTCRGATFEQASRRALRALSEFRVRGVNTNIAFVQAVLQNDEFVAGGVTTSFIDRHPELLQASAGSDRATRLLSYLGDVTVNRPHGQSPTATDPTTKLPTLDNEASPGSKQRLDQLGPAKFAAWLRSDSAVHVTDTTLRDAHQSILATRVRTTDLQHGARAASRLLPNLLSLECWGGATYDVALRFLHEDPWDRLALIREAAPNLCLQMLLRGRNVLGYTAYPDSVVAAFVEEAAATGIDIFRIFDAFNEIEQMRPAIEATLRAGAVAEGTICYTADLSDPAESVYTLDYYLGIAQQLVDAGVHILCVKDMAGLLRAPAARTLVTALRERFDTPVHLHTHDTAGGQLATYLAAINAGVDAVDGASAPLSGMTSQPSLSAIVAATDHSQRTTGLSLAALADIEPYWESVRTLYGPFEAGLAAPTGSVYRHQIPGGQLSNLRQQAIALGLGDRFEQIELVYAECDDLLGNLIKVTPSSKVVGDLALHLIGTGTSIEQLRDDPSSIDLPDSVIGFLHGELGTPTAGFPEPFRTLALAGRRPRATPPLLSAEQLGRLDTDRRSALNHLLLPTPAAAFDQHSETYGDVSVLPTRLFWYGLEPGADDEPVDLERGVRLLVGLEAIGDPDSRGLRTVLFRLNGQIRPLLVRDDSIESGVVSAEKADPDAVGHVAAPFNGVVSLRVAVGDEVAAGDQVAAIEAMKMESAISAPVSGVVKRLAVANVASVDGGDLLLVVAAQ
ncbi:MAG: pyruvate carboxylase [Actinobacteria bacterium]|nr:pyruvate carboxylase [Actinomycetota bacterium]